METLTLELDDATLRRLEAEARRTGQRPEDVARACVEAAFAIPPTPESDIDALGAYLTAKNAELYRRLA